jgi:hypothetical protein
MKAEHRKELETNTLANKMGQAMQRVKGGNRKTFLLTLIAAAVVAVVLYVVYQRSSESRAETANAWLKLDDGGQKSLDELKRDIGTNPGKAALLQYAWLLYWEAGVKRVGTDPLGAMQALEEAGKAYRILAKECESEDPLLYLPQALLGAAVVDECRAIQDRDFLKKAQDGYKALQEDKFKDTAEQKFAKGRLDQLKDAKKFEEIKASYEELQKALGVRGMQGIPGLGHPELKDLGPLAPPDTKK